MEKKIQVRRFGLVHYHAGCYSCDFAAAIQLKKGEYTPEDVRKLVRQHVRETGHEVWIESGTHIRYSLDGARSEDR